jgi:hypothetical protein
MRERGAQCAIEKGHLPNRIKSIETTARTDLGAGYFTIDADADSHPPAEACNQPIQELENQRQTAFNLRKRSTTCTHAWGTRTTTGALYARAGSNVQGERTFYAGFDSNGAQEGDAETGHEALCLEMRCPAHGGTSCPTGRFGAVLTADFPDCPLSRAQEYGFFDLASKGFGNEENKVEELV